MFNFSNKTHSVSAKDAAEKVLAQGVGFIDVRTTAEYSSGHARGAMNVPLDVLNDHLEQLKDQSAVYVICRSGGRSRDAVGLLASLGVEAVNVEGGTIAWQALGLPME